MPSLYNLFMRPLEKKGIRTARKNLLHRAHGSVLEIGAGTGVNLPFYDFEKIEELYVTDQRQNKYLDESYDDKLTFVEAKVEQLPFSSSTFDVVVHTLVFCSVSNVNHGLQEVKRVLKPTGTLLFIEHVLPEKKGWRTLFKMVNPMWRMISKGCSLTKSFANSLEENGFTLVHQGKFMNTVFYYGVASINAE